MTAALNAASERFLHPRTAMWAGPGLKLGYRPAGVERGSAGVKHTKR